MVDPYAPPADSAARPPRPTPTPYTEPSTTATGQVYEQAPPPARRSTEDYEERRRAWRRDHDRDTVHEPRTDPARPGLFWVVAAIGIGLLLLGRLVLYFAVADELDGEVSAPAFLAVLGVIALSAGLALAGVLQRGLATPWRIALLLGAGFFAIAGWDGPGFGFGLL